MKIGEEVIATAIFIPFLTYAFISISALQKADAVQETKIEYLIKITEETRDDVKTLTKEKKDGRHQRN